MPVGRRADFFLGGKPFMLARGQFKGRAWNRTGASDAPGRRSDLDAKYGQLPDELDHPEVWDDWSGGYGHAYRRQGENTYHWAENFDARFPRQLVHAQQLIRGADIGRGASTFLNMDNAMDVPIASRQRGDSQVMINGRYKEYTVAFTGNNFSEIILGGNVDQSLSYIGRPATFGSWYYLGVAEATHFMLVNNGLGLVDVGSKMESKCFAVVGDRLWRAFGTEGVADSPVTYIRSLAGGAAPTATANWSATIQVGGGRSEIRDMIGLDDQLCVGMTDGLYVGDTSGTFVNVMSELSPQRHWDNCRDLAIYNGAVIAPHVTGLYQYRNDGLTAGVAEIGPPSPGKGNPIGGYPRAVTKSGQWLLVGQWTGSQSYIMAGRPGNNNWIWHPLNRLPDPAQVHRLFISGSTVSSGLVNLLPNRFWVMTNCSLPPGVTGSAHTYFAGIPAFFGNPLGPSPGFSANYVGSARMDLGNVDWGAPSTPKVYRSVEVWADMLLSGYRYGDIYYDVDHSGSFTLLGRAQTSPKSTLYFSSGEGSFVTGQSIELSLQSFTASPAFTPVYRTIALRGALRPNSVDEITAVVRIAEGIRDRQGGEMPSAATMLQDLRDFGVSAAPTTLIDIAGAVNYVNVLGTPQEQEVYQQGEDNPEIAATIRMAVLTFSGS